VSASSSTSRMRRCCGAMCGAYPDAGEKPYAQRCFSITLRKSSHRRVPFTTYS
jgi:hypothetical protein